MSKKDIVSRFKRLQKTVPDKNAPAFSVNEVAQLLPSKIYLVGETRSWWEEPDTYFFLTKEEADQHAIALIINTLNAVGDGFATPVDFWHAAAAGDAERAITAIDADASWYEFNIWIEELKLEAPLSVNHKKLQLKLLSLVDTGRD